MTDPVSSEPEGIAVTPDTTTALSIAPFTGSSTLLVFDARVFNTLTLNDVPAGIVTSRNLGSGGGGGGGGVPTVTGRAGLASVAAGGLAGLSAVAAGGA